MQNQLDKWSYFPTMPVSVWDRHAHTETDTETQDNSIHCLVVHSKMQECKNKWRHHLTQSAQ